MQYSAVEMHHLTKNQSFNIQKYGLSVYFGTSQNITTFIPPSRLFAYLDFRVLKKEKEITFIFNHLLPDPVKLVWEGSGNQEIK